MVLRAHLDPLPRRGHFMATGEYGLGGWCTSGCRRMRRLRSTTKDVELLSTTRRGVDPRGHVTLSGDSVVLRALDDALPRDGGRSGGRHRRFGLCGDHRGSRSLRRSTEDVELLSTARRGVDARRSTIREEFGPARSKGRGFQVSESYMLHCGVERLAGRGRTFLNRMAKEGGYYQYHGTPVWILARTSCTLNTAKLYWLFALDT